jgi:hypothetical protein
MEEKKGFSLGFRKGVEYLLGATVPQALGCGVSCFAPQREEIITVEKITKYPRIFCIMVGTFQLVRALFNKRKDELISRVCPIQELSCEE